jgi:pimeloyl-ACP methyl ester carboxylesterase
MPPSMRKRQVSRHSLYPRAVSAISVTREGEGPEVLLVHEGASPEATWRALAPLAAGWTLASVHRRGYPPGPPVHRRQDFAVDASDILPLLSSRPHLVAHSYGVLGTCSRRPKGRRMCALSP